ncbi:MAG: hypothetical protein WCJ30_04705, partial [Deltaproteobacteria bacterium]
MLLAMLIGAQACTPSGRAVTVRFNLAASGLPDPLEIPFPSDIYRSDPDGTIVDTLGQWSHIGVTVNAEALRLAYSRLDGFGRTSGAMFLIDGPVAIDQSTLPSEVTASTAPDSATVFVDLTGNPDSAPRRIRHTARYITALHVLSVVPEEVLGAGTTYAVVTTNRIRTTERVELSASTSFIDIRDNRASARTTALGALYGRTIDRLVSHGLDRGRITGLSVFTTQTTHRGLRVIRDALVAGQFDQVPQLNMDAAHSGRFNVTRFGAAPHAGWTASLDEWLGVAERDASGRDVPGVFGITEAGTMSITPAHDGIGAVLTGTITVPEFRRP